MTRGALRVVPLSAEHDRSTFASGCEPLDSYFRQRVNVESSVMWSSKDKRR